MTTLKAGADEFVGTIDIGTNSVLLLVARRTASGLVPVHEAATITRLGEGVDRNRELSAAACERTLECLAAYATELQSRGVKRIDVVGTSAMRDARGGEQFRARAAEILGVEPRVVGGEEEARLTFKGGLSGLKLPPSSEVVVFDIGGGSTEFIRGAASGSVTQAISLDIGSVRLTERCVQEDPVSTADLARLESTIAETLAKNPVKAGGDVRVVGVAGTVTTLLAIANNIDPYDAKLVHGAELSRENAQRVFELLRRTPLDERCRLPGLSPKRADVIVAGALLCARVLESLGATTMLVSDRGVRWGLADELSQS